MKAESEATPVLRATGIHKHFGGVHALRSANLAVYAAEVHALVGENGSGKSTLLRILSGQLQPDSGDIEFDGESVTLRSETEALRLGIATVTQETTLVPELSIAENIYLGHRQARRAGLIDWRETRARAATALAGLGLTLQPSARVARLRMNQQQMVEIARALSRSSRVLILDEPTSSMTNDEVETLFSTVRRIKRDGVATIFVSHRLGEIFELADRVTVLRDGRAVASGPIAEFDRKSLIHAMVGRALDDLDEPGEVRREEEGRALTVRRLSLDGLFEDVDLDIAPGEIVGIAGLVGSGCREVLESIFGLRRPTAGEVIVGGRAVAHRGPIEAIKAGIGFVPADRKSDGLVPTMSVEKNLLMTATSRRFRFRMPSPPRERTAVQRVIENVHIKAHSPAAPVSTLSGGNQQKVVLGKCLANRPQVLLLDDPTRGVDVGAKTEIYRLLFEAAEEGVAMLVTSSETPELLTLCSRIHVMFRGRLVATLDRETATEARVAHFAGGHR
jgi:ABC-type sugar transport system ATPase subunit